MAARAQRKTGNILGLVLATPKDPTSDIGHVVMISGFHRQGCDTDDWYECEVTEYDSQYSAWGNFHGSSYPAITTEMSGNSLPKFRLLGSSLSVAVKNPKIHDRR